MAEKLQELDKDLSNTATHVFPEEYIRKTLIAHGFFTHAKLLEERKKQAKLKQEEIERSKIPEIGISNEDKRRTTQLIYHYKEGKEFHSLREPLSLQKRRQQFSNRILPKWPAEVPCLDHCTVFINDQPLLPEPLQKPDVTILSPKIRSAYGEGTVVFNNRPGPQKFFTHSRYGPSTHEPHPRQRQVSGESLSFESRFESGNLAKAVRVGRWDYELYLRCDLYTHKHTQWFFFSVQNMKAGQTYRFTIVNLYKPSSLYNDGMQPLLHSEKRAMLHGIGWRRVGFNIKYFKTNVRRTDTKADVSNYGLTWSYTFLYDNDTCYFSHCYPYTYTDLQEYLSNIAKDPKKSTFCKQRSLCHSIAGNTVHLLTITSPAGSPNEAQNKRTVVVSARVHPGETNGSWMMKGMLDFLLSNSPDAQILRDAFVFKIIPMLNPDGVIVGNYRCSLSGRDLNRNYKTQLKEAYPTIWHSKQLFKQLTKEREVVMYCDFHGHSRKQNVFIYGCDKIQNPSLRLRSRVFPKMLSLNAPNKFSYKGCNFKVQKSKEGTGRVYMWKEYDVINSYTMEATFCGSNLGNSQGYHFSTKELELMGYHFCDTLLDYCDPDQTKVEYILTQLTDEYRQSLVDKLQSLGVDIPDGVDPLDVEFDSDILSGIDSSDDGSDSSESDGPPMHMMDKVGKKKRTKKLQTRKERNSRRKAQLKLTHKFNQSPLHNVDKGLVQVTSFEKPIEKSEPSVISVNDGSVNNVMLPYNGGMPKFIQERISERQRKDSASRSDYVEIVTADYMRNGLPQSITLQANKELQQSTASLQTQPLDCPMAISSMVLRQPSLSRTTSNSGLPQILNPTDSGLFNKELSRPGGAFASNYVANHLKDNTSSYNNSDELVPDNTQNLMSLSKLFRTLKPHLMNSVHRQKSDSNITRIASAYTKPKMEYVSFTGDPIPQRKLPHLADLPPSNQQHELPNDTSEHQQQTNDHIPLLTASDNVKNAFINNETLQDARLPPVNNSVSLTASDQIVMESTTSSTIGTNNNTAKPSPVTNKRESAFKESGSTSSNNLEDNSMPLHLVQPPTTSLQLSFKENQPALNKTGYNDNQPSSVSNTSTTGIRLNSINRTDNGSLTQLMNFETHKQQVATAVESLQNKRKLFKDSHFRTVNTKRPNTSSSFPPAGTVGDVLMGYPPSNNSRGIQTSEGFRKKGKEKNKKQKESIPQWKIYSSKSTPLNQNTKDKGAGVCPATVSLMLPGQPTYPAPSSIGQSRSLNTRYYSSHKRGIF